LSKNTACTSRLSDGIVLLNMGKPEEFPIFPIHIILLYWRSCKTEVLLWLAWASIAVPD
jgi:hypothetical protein